MIWQILMMEFTKGLAVGMVITILLEYNKWTRLIVYGGLVLSVVFLIITPQEVLISSVSSWDSSFAYILGIFIGTPIGRLSAKEMKEDWQQ